MKKYTRVFCGLLLGASCVTGALAQNGSTAKQTHLLTETAALFRLTGETRTELPFESDAEPPIYGSFDFGVIRELSSRSAVGGTAFVGASWDMWRIGVRGRYRLWTSRDSHFDLSPGLILVGGNSRSEVDLPAFVMNLSYAPREWFSLTANAEIIKHSRQIGFDVLNPQFVHWTEKSVYLGAKLEEKPGLIAGVTAGLTAAAITLFILIMFPGD